MDVVQKKYKFLSNFIWTLVFVNSIWWGLYGYSKLKENLTYIITLSCYISIILLAYTYIIGAINDINDDIIKDYYETNQKIATKIAV